MIRVLRSGKVCLVAAITCGGKRRVIVVDVALRARNRGVRSRQRERRIVVIKCRLCPRDRVVARLAGRRET